MTGLQTAAVGRAHTMACLEAARRRADASHAAVAAVLDHTAELPPDAEITVACLRRLIGWPHPDDDKEHRRDAR